MTATSQNKYFKGPKTLKALAFDFIQGKGIATSTEIRKFLYETSRPGLTFDPIKHRGYFSSYFSDSGTYIASLYGGTIKRAALTYKGRNDERFAVKLPSGKYSVIDPANF